MGVSFFWFVHRHVASTAPLFGDGPCGRKRTFVLPSFIRRFCSCRSQRNRPCVSFAASTLAICVVPGWSAHLGLGKVSLNLVAHCDAIAVCPLHRRGCHPSRIFRLRRTLFQDLRLPLAQRIIFQHPAHGAALRGEGLHELSRTRSSCDARFQIVADDCQAPRSPPHRLAGLLHKK
jgi:hypothetical protein